MDKKIGLAIGGLGIAAGLAAIFLKGKKTEAAVTPIPDNNLSDPEVTPTDPNDPTPTVLPDIPDFTGLSLDSLSLPANGVASGAEYWPEAVLSLPYGEQVTYHFSLFGRSEDLPIVNINGQEYASGIPVMSFYLCGPATSYQPDGAIDLDPNATQYHLRGSVMVKESAPSNISQEIARLVAERAALEDQLMDEVHFYYSPEYNNLQLNEQRAHDALRQSLADRIDADRAEESRLRNSYYNQFKAAAAKAQYNEPQAGFAGAVDLIKKDLPPGQYPLDVTIKRIIAGQTEEFGYPQVGVLIVT